MRVYGKEEGTSSNTGIVYNQERWYKYPLAFGDFADNGGTWEANVSVPSHAICSGIKVVPTVQWTSASSPTLEISNATSTLLSSYDILLPPANDEFKASLVYETISDGTITVSMTAEPTAGELDLWLMLSNPGND